MFARFLAHPAVYAWRLRHGIGPHGRSFHHLARQAGVTLTWPPGEVWVHRDDWELAFRREHLRALLWALQNVPTCLGRMRFVAVGGRRRADCRGEGPYLLSTGDEVFLPSPPEPLDFAAGYFARGAPEPGALVFDVGAYAGETAIILARAVGPTGRVVAFEPDPAARAYFARNVARAGLGNVTLVPAGLWREDARLSFASGGSPSGHLSRDGRQQVDVITLAHACRLAGRAPDFVKMDIEGAEVPALEGAGEILAQHPIRFAIASYHRWEGRTTAAWLVPFFQRHGYTAESGYPPHPTTWAWRA